MRVTVIHNPGAGEPARAESLVTELTEGGYEVTYANVKKTPLDEALARPGDLVVAAGGDGTVRKVASKLLGRSIPMVVVPLGTANNIAATLGVHDRPHHLAEYFHDLVEIPFDIGKWSFSGEEQPFLESTGIGLLTTMMSELRNRKKQDRVEDKERGFADELEALHDITLRADPFTAKITADGDDLSGDYLLIELMNIRSVGPNLELAPTANPSDGLFDLVLVAESDRELFDSFVDATRRRKPLPDLPRKRVRAIDVECIGGKIHMDDQMINRTNAFQVSMQAGAVKMLAPARAESHGRRQKDRRSQ